MRVDTTIPGLIRIQLPNDERASFDGRLRALSSGRESELQVRAENKTITFRLVQSGIHIDCTQRDLINVEFAKDECEYLADAIQEHLSDPSGLPLDHSFESLGARIEPSQIKDVVFETVSR